MHPLSSLIEKSENIVFFTGAGVSTASGIPDFRSPGGVWSQFRIVNYGEFLDSEIKRQEDWKRRFFTADMLSVCKPNVAHKTMAQFARTGKCRAIVTQNTDDLHNQVAQADDVVIELHGNSSRARCLKCGVSYTMSDCRRIHDETEQSPVCTECGGLIKSNVIMFGEPMPGQAMEDALFESQGSDLFVVVGSSLQVFPAANLPEEAKINGAKLAIVNREPTSVDRKADLIVHEEIPAVFEKVASDLSLEV